MNKPNGIDKKEQFIHPRKSRRFLAIAVFLLVAGLLAIGVLLGDIGQSRNTDNPVAEPRLYVGRVEKMKNVVPVIQDDKIVLKLSDVDLLNIVAFDAIDRQGTVVPMMAYITSSGRLFVGSSVCLCGSQSYALAGETLFCTECRTTFTIEDRQYISGAITIGQHPPAGIKFVVEDGLILIDRQEIEILPSRATDAVGN